MARTTKAFKVMLTDPHARGLPMDRNVHLRMASEHVKVIRAHARRNHRTFSSQLRVWIYEGALREGAHK